MNAALATTTNTLDPQERIRLIRAWSTRGTDPDRFWPGEPKCPTETIKTLCPGCGTIVNPADMTWSRVANDMVCLDCEMQSRAGAS